jgi:hypothetical protein
MELNKLLNTEENRRRRPLSDVTANQVVNLKRVKSVGAIRSNNSVISGVENDMDMIPSVKSKISLPSFSHISEGLTRVPSTTMSPMIPVTPSKMTPHRCQKYLYVVQNSKKKQEMFVNITSSKDFQRSKKAKNMTTPSKKPLTQGMSYMVSPDSSSDLSLSANKSAARRWGIWSNETSIAAAREFKRIAEKKGSSSFLKKEYQMVADRLNVQFETDKFTEPTVRNRKGLFQSISLIFVYLREHPTLNKFDENYIPQLTESEWSKLNIKFEAAYIRKFRNKTDNTDLHIICDIFKKRSFKSFEDHQCSIEES